MTPAATRRSLRAVPRPRASSSSRCTAALDASGADAVMVGRGAYGRPWFPGHLAHYLTTGEKRSAPPLGEQFAIISALYDQMIAHHGARIGVKHARKHLGWALDAAADEAGASAGE